MQELFVETMMSRNVETVPPDLPLDDLWTKMRVSERFHVVVVDGESPVGTIGEKNLACLLSDLSAGRQKMPHAAGEIMTSPPICVAPRESVERALDLMTATGVSELIVADGEGRLLGSVSSDALLRGQLQRVEMERSLLEGDLAERTRELVEANLRLRSESLEDDLLAIPNRRAMHGDLEQIHELARRFRRPYGALLFDVDHFKAYNDKYGHLAGDHVLRQVAKVLGNAVRKVDRLYRYGGEEILAVLPETGDQGAVTVAERARAGVEGLAIPHAGSPHEVVTVSCGVCVSGTSGTHPADWEQVVKKADDLLYEAKEAGRNQVRIELLDPADQT